MSKYKIADVLEKLSIHNKGLTLLTNPPGSGKSYETSKFIAKALLDSEFTRKIYYITPRVKNLNDLNNSVLEALNDINHPELKESILKIESNRDCILNNFDKIKKKLKIISEDKPELESIFSTLSLNLDILSRHPENKNLYNLIFGDKYTSLERTFRRKLSDEFRKDFFSQNIYSSEYEYMMQSKWSFIKDLYPAALSSKRQLFIMSSAKFFLKNDPIITPSYSFTSEKNIENTLVIIDEIDAIKMDILDGILIDKNNYDLVDIFEIIFRSLNNIDERYEYPFEFTNTENTIIQLSQEADKLKRKFFPEKWNIRLFDENKDSGKLEEFNDYDKLMNYLGINKFQDLEKCYKFIPYKSGEKSNNTLMKCNKILPEKYCKKFAEYYDISTFLNEINKFINNFFNSIYFISKTYKRMKNEEIKKHNNHIGRLISIENSISTILKDLTFSDDVSRDFVEFIVRRSEIVQYLKLKEKFKRCDKKSSYSVYEDGLSFTLVSVPDAFHHNCKLNTYDLPETPEIILTNLATKAHILGISATAENTGTQNFNFDFIKKKLNNLHSSDVKFHKIPQKIITSLEKDFKRKTKGYRDKNNNSLVNTIVKPIKFLNLDIKDKSKILDYYLAYIMTGNQNISKESLKIVKNHPFSQKYVSIQMNLAQSMLSNPGSYEIPRLIKVLLYIREVLYNYKNHCLDNNESHISNGIIMCNKIIGDDNKFEEIYSLDNLKLGTVYICKDIFNISFEDAIEMVEDDLFIKISAADIKDSENPKIKKIEEKFREEKPVFMVTSYSSVSRGNNLQVKINTDTDDFIDKRLNNGKLVRINDWKINGYLDWDSIYLEKPAHVIPKLENNSIIKDKTKTFLLIEELFEKHQITYSKKQVVFKEVFDSFNYNNSCKEIFFENYNSIYHIDAVKSDYSTYVYQTIGRISRTNFKKKNNGIYYDFDLTDYIEVDLDKLGIPSELVTNEFKSFLVSVNLEKDTLFYNLLSSSYDKFSKKNLSTYRAITRILEEGNSDTGWREDTRYIWEHLRKKVLEYPVITKSKFKELKKEFNSLKGVSRLGIDFDDLYLNFDIENNDKILDKNNLFYYYSTQSGKFMYLQDGEPIKNDFERIAIPNILCKNPNNLFKFKVSIEDSRLDTLLNNDVIYKYWIDNEFKTDWKIDNKDDFYGIISPIVFNNIYKGAVGEEALKAILLDKKYKIKNIENPLEYEKFDFIIEQNDKRIYVDAKNFSELSLCKDYANEDLLPKLMEKGKSINSDCLLVINLFDMFSEREFIDQVDNKYSNSRILSIPGIFYTDGKNNPIYKQYHNKTLFDLINSVLYPNSEI